MVVLKLNLKQYRKKYQVYGWPNYMNTTSFKNYKEKVLANRQSYH